MNEDETFTFEDRTYVNPQVSLAEQDQFIEKFRDIQNQNQAQINQQTQALGSQMPSNQGGLIGAEGMYDVAYRRPQVNAAIENLRATNLLEAVNATMTNEQNAMANRLDQAKRAYYRALQEQSKRDRDKANSSNPANLIRDSLQINTNSGDIDNLGVRENEQARQDYDSSFQPQLNEAMQSALKDIQSGEYGKEKTAVFSYVKDGQTVYGKVYRDALGRIQGVSTPDGDYNASNGQNFLLGLAQGSNLLNSAGQALTANDILFVR